MFRRLDNYSTEDLATISYEFNGKMLHAISGENLAAALLREGVPFFRLHPIDSSQRLPFCMMGVCQECLVTVDGGGTRRSCLITVQQGIVVRSVSKIDQVGDAL